LAPGWYRESLICIIFYFVISWVVILFILLFCEVDHQIQNTEYVFLVVTLLGRYRTGRPNFPRVYRALTPANSKNPKFVSWARIRARLGKSQVQVPITCSLVDGLMIYNWNMLFQVFQSCTLYMYIILFP
jgi:hypothetical protein